MSRRGYRTTGIPITPKEREFGVKVAVFESWNLEDALEDKVKWFAKKKHLTILKEKTKVTHGRGAVVGKWKSSKVYVSFIPTKKLATFNDYKHKKRLIRRQAKSVTS